MKIFQKIFRVKIENCYDKKNFLRPSIGVRPFSCVICEKSFSQKCALALHTRAHNNNTTGLLILLKNFIRFIFNFSCINVVII